MKTFYKLVAITALVISQLSYSAILTVGNDGACGYATIQTAIDVGNDNEIRISSNGGVSYFEHLIINDKNIKLKGGYANCSAALANITDSSRAIIDGSDTGIVINIQGNQNINEVDIRYLELINADIGISKSAADANVTLHKVSISNHNISGYSTNGGLGDSILSQTTVSNNQGSGVVCNGADNKLILTDNTDISFNTSDLDGGGLRLINECSSTIYSPVLIHDNASNGDGGGIYVGSASDLNTVYSFYKCENGICFGDNTKPVRIYNNTANADNDSSGGGGAIAVYGNNSGAAIFNSVIEGNKALKGGAVYSSGIGTVVYLIGEDNSNCWNPGRCMQFNNNKAQTDGGAFYGKSSSTIYVVSAYVQGSRANFGVVGFVKINADLLINNSVIVNNGNNSEDGYLDARLLTVFNQNANLTDTRITLEYVTISNNKLNSLGDVLTNVNGHFSVVSSIIDDVLDTYGFSTPISSHFECVISSEIASMNSGGTVTQSTPNFMDKAGGDFRLKPDSDGIDYCYDINQAISIDDMYSVEHGFDDPNKTNLHGTFDLGAYEYVISNDIIFKNSFELN